MDGIILKIWIRGIGTLRLSNFMVETCWFKKWYIKYIEYTLTDDCTTRY